MPRIDRSLPHRSTPLDLAWSQTCRFLGWLGPRLETQARQWAARAIAFVEGDEARTLLDRTLRRSRTALRWARDNDTVAAETVKQALSRYEQRLIDAERRRTQREQRRLEKEAARQRRNQQYGEKSSIYLG
ncbi:MAG: hypothetical protein WCO00_09905 [Rhodospirillaceae bacterium]